MRGLVAVTLVRSPFFSSYLKAPLTLPSPLWVEGKSVCPLTSILSPRGEEEEMEGILFPMGRG